MLDDDELHRLLLIRARVCQETAAVHRQRGEGQTAAWLEGKAWGFREAAGHLRPDTKAART